MTISDELRNNLTPAVFGTLFGAFVTFIVSTLANKTARLRYSTVVERIALAADDPIFGSVQITWNNGLPRRNLYLATMEVENASSRDFEAVEFTVYCDFNTDLLTESTVVPGEPYSISWSPSFQATLAVPPGGAASQAQMNTYLHRREYIVPVLNRGQLLHFKYLCTRPNDDVTPDIFLSTRLKGARLVPQFRRTLVHGIPQRIALIHGLAIAFLTAVACSYFLHSAPKASIICMAVGLFAQFLGAFEYRFWKALWKLLAG